MNTCCVVRSSRPAGLFSFGLLDGLPVRLRQPHLREAPAGFGLERLAAAFMNNPGEDHSSITSPDHFYGGDDAIKIVYRIRANVSTECSQCILVVSFRLTVSGGADAGNFFPSRTCGLPYR